MGESGGAYGIFSMFFHGLVKEEGKDGAARLKNESVCGDDDAVSGAHGHVA